LDAPGRGIKEKLRQVLAKQPALKDEQLVSAVYLLCLARYPTAEEARREKKRFTETKSCLVPALQLARALVQEKEFNAEVAAAISRILKEQKELAAEPPSPTKLLRLNNEQAQKMYEEIARLLNKAAKSDKQIVELAFLVVVSRFPEPKDLNPALEHFKKHTNNRAIATQNIVWALMNTKEFVMGQR
jgi:hypothetical protein